MTDRIVYKVVTKDGGIDGRSQEKGGQVKFASFDRREAVGRLDGYSELKLEVIEDVELKYREVLKRLDKVDLLLLEEYFK